MQKSFLIKLWLLFQLLQEQKAEKEDKYEPIIMGGVQVTKIEDFPYQVAIFKGYRRATFYCGGSIISRRFVLSAAHCFVEKNIAVPAKFFIIRYGSTNLRSHSRLLKRATNIYIPENFFKDRTFDIAMVQVEGLFHFSSKTLPVPLSSSVEVGAQCTCSGWGRLTFEGSIVANLMHVNLTIISDEECAKNYNMTPQQFCAYGKGKDACHGDSGGPLVCSNHLTGIVSRGKKCGIVPGSYTKVPYFREWIRKIKFEASTRSLSSKCWKIKPSTIIFLSAYLALYINYIV